MEKFLDKPLIEMLEIGKEDTVDTCAVCCLVKNLLPGGSMKIVRESPTSALVRFKVGSVERGSMKIEGKKSVWNVRKEERYDLTVGISCLLLLVMCIE
jgi:hypothetical protein